MLIQCLIEGNTTNFTNKESDFIHAANVLKPLHKAGAEKGAKACKNKWSSVRISLL